MAELAAAVALNPSFALARAIHGWALVRAGRYDEVIAETATALRRTPGGRGECEQNHRPGAILL